jgi:hypothetical protein
MEFTLLIARIHQPLLEAKTNLGLKQISAGAFAKWARRKLPFIGI